MEPSAQGRLELEIEDFGPIVEAKLDLRPLTVFVGPSNTGKSYLAVLIYALHRHWAAGGSGSTYFRRGFRAFHPSDLYDSTHDVVEAAFAFVKKIFDKNKKNLSKNDVLIPPYFANIIRKNYTERGIYLGDEIRRCFGIEETATLIRRGSKVDGSVTARIRYPNTGTSIDHGFRINKKNTNFETFIPENSSLPIDTEKRNQTLQRLQEFVTDDSITSDRVPEEVRRWNEDRLVETLASVVHPFIVGSLTHDAYYLPADRTGIMHAHNVVVGALIGSAAMAGVRPAARTPLLTGVLADFLEELIILGRRPGRRRRTSRGLAARMEESHYRNLGDRIEESILRGAIAVEKSEAVDYPHFTYKPEGWKDSLSLASASSMVSELAPIVLYLRHIVESGDMLIIEEPESHLHPAMQAQLIREIAMLVRAGVRVLVTTHSEWVLEELANIVGRSKLPESKQNDLTGNKTALPTSDVGVWLFEPKERPKGSVVREIPLDESGLYPTGFDEVAAALHNDWADIASRSQETG